MFELDNDFVTTVLHVSHTNGKAAKIMKRFFQLEASTHTVSINSLKARHLGLENNWGNLSRHPLGRATDTTKLIKKGPQTFSKPFKNILPIGLFYFMHTVRTSILIFQNKDIPKFVILHECQRAVKT